MNGMANFGAKLESSSNFSCSMMQYSLACQERNREGQNERKLRKPIIILWGTILRSTSFPHTGKIESPLGTKNHMKTQSSLFLVIKLPM